MMMMKVLVMMHIFLKCTNFNLVVIGLSYISCFGLGVKTPPSLTYLLTGNRQSNQLGVLIALGMHFLKL